ncbi:zinc finger CCHC domain-containing protein 8 homolog [Centruroides vittatus]|uniref:zinc finger CCHC domain-containing protein 8 homolog n=1 Tax=Centruroides vittatus TaxID=120091 RepID=UPI00350F5A46
MAKARKEIDGGRCSKEVENVDDKSNSEFLIPESTDYLVVIDSVGSDDSCNEPSDKQLSTRKCFDEKLQKELELLREENVKLKNQINNLISRKKVPNDSSAIQISFKNNVLAKKYRHEVEKFLRDLLSKEDDALIQFDEKEGNQVQLYQNFCLDVCPLEDNMTKSPSSWGIPVYDKNYVEDVSSENVSLEETETKRTNLVTCFNCLGNHTVNKCTEKLDRKKIYLNRKMFSQNRTNAGRYHEDSDQNPKFKPGVISENLRKALDLESYQLPLYIYHMRILGYPPGWLKMAEVESSGITMYDSEGKPEGEIKEDGEIECNYPRIQYDPKKLISYPGFNVPAPQNFIDEYKTLKMPSMQFCHLRSEAEKKMKAPEAVPYRKRKLDVKPDKKRKVERLHHDCQDMDVDDIGTELVELDEKETQMCKFIPPLPPDSSLDLPPPPPPEENFSIISNQEKISSSRMTYLSLSDLEEVKQQIMLELEKTSETSDSTKDCSLSQDSKLSLQLEELDTVSDNSQNSVERTIKYSNSLSIIEGTPVVTSHNPFNNLPNPSKFSLGVSEHLPFENLPNSTGTYEKMKDVLNKVRKKVRI